MPIQKTSSTPADGTRATRKAGTSVRIRPSRAWCRRGPPSADVEDVDVKLRAPRNEFRTFTVAR